MSNNTYKGIVTYERPDGSKTITECKFTTEYSCMNWVFDQIMNVHKYSNYSYSDMPDSIIGEVIGGGKRTVYTMGFNILTENSNKSTPKISPKPKQMKPQCYSKRVYLYWNKDTRSILGTYNTSIGADVERNGWIKLNTDTPNIGTNYFSNCVNWIVAIMSNDGNYKLTKVKYAHKNNNPDAFKAYVRSIL